MATYVLVPGADGRAWYWHLVVPAAGRPGHEVVTFDLPADDPADLDAFADAIVAAVRPRRTGRRARGRGAVARRLLRAAGLRPAAGRPARPGQRDGAAARRDRGGVVGRHRARQARATHAPRAGPGPRRRVRPADRLLPRRTAAVTEEAFAARAQAGRRPRSSRSHGRWSGGRTSRPASSRAGTTASSRWNSRRRVVRERLGPGVVVEELPGGHLVALCRPEELVAALLREG